MQQASRPPRRQLTFAWRNDRRTLTLGFIAAAIIEITVFAILLLNTSNLTTSKDWVTHTHIVLEKLHDVQSDLDDAALSQQVFLLTADSSTRARLSAAEQATRQDTADVRQLTADNPVQQHNLDVLTPQITSWLDTLQPTVRSTADAQALDAIRRQIGLMEDEENRLLQVRDQQANTSTQIAVLALVGGGLLSLGLFIIVAVGRDMNERRQMQEMLQRSEERYQMLVERIEDYEAYTIDPGGHVATWNPSIQRLKGYSESDILGQHISRFFTPEDVQAGKPQRLLEIAASQGRVDDEGWRVRKDGSRFWANVVIIALHNPDGSLYGFTKITRDVTERRRAEGRIQKLNRIYRILSDINQTIVRVRQMPAMFEAACSIAVEKGSFRMAWIGLLDSQTQRINIVAHSGIVEGYLEKLNIDLNDSTRGKGPTGSSVAVGGHVVCNDIEHDAQMAPWREDALRLGFRASASFPLMIAGKVRGTFNLYAGEAGFFDDEELALLDELALDISFAIEFAEQDELRQQAQAGLQRYTQRLEILHDIDTGIIEARSIQAIVGSTLSHIRRLIACQRADVTIMDETSGDALIFAVGLDGDTMLGQGVHIPIPPNFSEGYDARHLRVFDDIRLFQETRPRARQLVNEGLLCALSVLLMDQESPIGVLGLFADTPGFFTAEHQEIAAQVGNQLIVAIRQLRLSDALAQRAAELERNIADLTRAESALQRYAQRMEILHEVDLGLIQGRSIPALVEVTLKRLRQLVPCQRTMASLIDNTTNEGLIFALDLDGETTLSQGVRMPIVPEALEGYDARHIRIFDDLRVLQDTVPRARVLVNEGLLCALNVLLMDQESPIGTLSLLANTPGFFTAEHQEIASEIANQLAIAIRQLQLSEELTRRTEDLERNVTDLKQAESALQRYAQRMEILHDIDSAIINATSIEAVVEATLKHIRRLIPCKRAHVAVIDQTLTEGLYFAIDLDAQTALDKGTRVPLTPAIFEGFDERHIRVIDDLRPLQEAVPQAKQFVSEGLVSTLQVLLMVQEQPIGALSLWADTSGFFTVEHQEIAVQVANQLAVAIQQLRLTTALVHRAAELEQSIAEIKRTQAERRQSDARYQRILETVHEGVWLTDGAARTTFANQAMADILGYSTTELLDIPPLQLIHNPLHEPTESRIERRQQGLSEQYDLQLRRKDGGIVWALVNASPILNDEGRYSGSAVTFADITERKQHETEMARKNRDLETLLYITSHDLREPLRAIRNFSQMVNDRYRDSLDAKGQDFLTRIARAGDRMDRLIEDILQLSRAQRKIAPADHLSGEALVAEALKPLDAKIQATNAEITINSPLPTFVVDRFWAGQAVFNLVANALKFVKLGERPEVEISAYVPSDDSPDGVGLVVRDRGIGLEPEQVERIFGLFQRAVGRDIEGTGAGLAIVREIAERHGGRAWAQPRADGGSEFFITFGRNAPNLS